MKLFIKTVKKFLTLQNVIFILSFLGSLIIAIIYSSALTWLIFLSSVFGILSSIFATKGKWLTYVFDILSYALYIYICIVNKYYGELILSVVIIVIHICALIEWKKNTVEDVVLVNRIGTKEILISVSIGTVFTVIYGVILFFINSQYPILNAISTVVYLLGNYYAYRRSQLQFLGWILYDVFFIIIWGLTIINGDYGSIIFLIGGISELIYGVIGIFSWSKIEREQRCEKQQNPKAVVSALSNNVNEDANIKTNKFNINKKQNKMSTVSKIGNKNKEQFSSTTTKK